MALIHDRGLGIYHQGETSMLRASSVIKIGRVLHCRVFINLMGHLTLKRQKFREPLLLAFLGVVLFLSIKDFISLIVISLRLFLL